MKKLSYLFAFMILISSVKVKADEGMWLPIFLERLNYVDMQKIGLQLTPEEIYSVNNGSLKDAIIGLSSSPNPQGFFCTGEIVSNEGLMFTNHHCGFGQIQKHSTTEHDYLADGFWAMNKSEELPNEELTASILHRMADVTDSILPNISDTLVGADRTAAIKKITAKLKKNASEDGKYNVVIKSFFAGNEYYMFVYQVYTDVRLVGAPPSSIGKYGGDTDNWMWPRHTGDFSIFRVYTAPDGSPADYAEENIPLVPKHYLPISLDPVEMDEFSMIWGFPGGTERFETSSGIDFKVKEFYPPIIEVFGKKLEVWKEHMNQDQEVRIKYASNYAGIANAWKLFIGQTKGIKDLDVYDDKKAFEEEFETWINEDQARQDKYGEVLSIINKANADKVNGYSALIFASLTGVGGAEITGYANSFSGLSTFMEQYKEEKDKKKKEKKQKQINKEVEKLVGNVSEQFKNYDMATDEDVFAAMTELYYNNVAQDMQPELLTKLVKKFKGNFSEIAAYVFDKSNFSTENKIIAFLNDPKLKTLQKDPAFILANQFMASLMNASGNIKRGGDDFKNATKLFVEGVREMQPNKNFYPDANSTLRFSYGQVMDYYPADAIHFDFVTHLSGVIDKEDPDNDEFEVAPKLKELYESKDYGQYGQDGKMIVCFLTNNDITGGNSGSPVVNGKGELTGIAFDGNWEAMSSDIAFAPNLQRTIVVDIHYVLFIIDKFAGATNLIDELTIVKTPAPVEVEEVEVIMVN
ncbi:MAG: S46 family peptidase [Bacteroidota bacterium]